MVLVKTGSIGLKVAKVLESEADIFVHLSGKLKTWDTAGENLPRSRWAGSSTLMGTLESDILPFDISNVKQECSWRSDHGTPGRIALVEDLFESIRQGALRKMALITKEADLNQLCDKLAQCSRCGIDLEFVPERTYEPVLCLVQIATEDGAHLVDPLVLPNLSRAVGCSPTAKTCWWILHAGNQDLDLIYSLCGNVPQNVFDTQIAAGFGGFGYPIGYGKLLNQLLGVSIAKTESYTDWTTRPLTPSQIEYATEDVLHLLPMYDKLCERLTESGRLEWVLEECRRLSNGDRYEKDKSLDFLRVKGASSLSRRGLAVLQALCDWRNAEARRVNRPTKSVVSDNTLLELARKPPRQIADIQRIRGVRVRSDSRSRQSDDGID